MKNYTIVCPKCKQKITRQEKHLKGNSLTGCICECGHPLVFPSIKEFKRREENGLNLQDSINCKHLNK